MVVIEIFFSFIIPYLEMRNYEPLVDIIGVSTLILICVTYIIVDKLNR